MMIENGMFSSMESDDSSSSSLATPNHNCHRHHHHHHHHHSDDDSNGSLRMNKTAKSTNDGMTQSGHLGDSIGGDGGDNEDEQATTRDTHENNRNDETTKRLSCKSAEINAGKKTSSSIENKTEMKKESGAQRNIVKRGTKRVSKKVLKLNQMTCSSFNHSIDITNSNSNGAIFDKSYDDEDSMNNSSMFYTFKYKYILLFYLFQSLVILPIFVVEG